MKRLLVMVAIVALAGCGGSAEPAACGLCGRWYSRYSGTPAGRDPNYSLTLNQDQAFAETFGSQPGLQGSWLASSSHLTLSYNSVTQQQTGTIVADSISFPTNSVFSARVYQR